MLTSASRSADAGSWPAATPAASARRKLARRGPRRARAPRLGRRGPAGGSVADRTPGRLIDEAVLVANQDAAPRRRAEPPRRRDRDDHAAGTGRRLAWTTCPGCATGCAPAGCRSVSTST